MPNANSFTTIRHWEGSQHRAFEEVAYQLLAGDAPAGAKAIRTGNPDGGVEWYATLPNGEEWGWQAKYVSNVPSLLSGMTESVKRVATERFRLVKLTFVVSINLSTGTNGNSRKSDRQKYEDQIVRWKSDIPGAGCIEFDIVQESDLLERLSLPEHRGRRWFWWNQTVLDHDSLLKLQKRQEAVAGERYRPQLQVDLPIQRDVDGLRVAQFIDDEFAEHIYRMAKTRLYLNEKDLERFPSLTHTLQEISPRLQHFQDILTQRNPISRSLEEVDFIRQVACSISEHLRDAYSAVIHERDRFLISGNSIEEDSGEEIRSINSMIFSINSIQDRVREVSEWLKKTPVRAAERGLYFLCGPAGSGKTHLFLDSAKSALNAKHPALVLFGDRFEHDLWGSICSQIGIPNTGSEVLLGALDAAAAISEGKLLILIDAINESPGRDFWKTNLPVLRASIQQYPRIALAVSCRDTYVDMVDPNNERQHFVVREHSGFSGMEIEATQRYFSHYGLESPRIPLLLPEFTIPLFLKLYCETLQASESLEMILGHEGRIAIFERYLDQKIEAVRQRVYHSVTGAVELRNRRLTVRHALDAVIETLADSTLSWVAWERAVSVVVKTTNCDDDRANQILGAFEHEGLLSQEPAYFRSNSHGMEIRITFQAFSDFLILSHRLAKYDNPLEEDDFKVWLSQHAWSGIMEVAAVLIPEKYGVEIPDLLNFQNHDQSPEQVARRDWIYRTFMNALPYRKSTSIMPRTIHHLNIALSMEWGVTSLYDVLYLIAPYENNPLNALGLHRHLSRFSMAKRDVQFGLATYWEIGEPSSPVSRLARWAADGPYPSYSDEVIELAATALMWLLSSANRRLRDWVTKALVQLLHGHLNVMCTLLNRFWHVNDPYVVQRVVLIAYGCLMRSDQQDRTSAKKLVEDVFTKFTDQPLRMDELLLDSGKGIIEWGIFHNLVPADSTAKLARPHGFPTLGHPLGVKRIQAKYETDYGAPRDASFSTVFSSVMGFGDFGRYVIESGLYRFTILRPDTLPPPKPSSEWRLDTRAIRRFEKSLTTEQVQRIGEYLATAQDSDLSSLLFPDDTSSPITLSDEQKRLLRAVWIRPAPATDIGFPTDVARRWLFLRTVSLGWRPDLFGEEDYFLSQRDDGRSEHKAERWGKKYQWIAFHELMARVTDNYQTHPDHGEEWAEWDPFLRMDSLRDLDPSLPPVNFRDFIDRNEEAMSWKESELELPGRVAVPIPFGSFHGDIDRFISERRAEPLAHLVAVAKDKSGQEWLALHSYETMREFISETRDWGLTQTMWLHSWFVSGSDTDRHAGKLLHVLREEVGGFNTPSYERGAYWGELNWMNRDESWMTSGWREIGRNNSVHVNIIDTCEDYSWESNGLDCSMENSAFAYVPSRFVLDKASLTADEEGASWKEQDGRPVFVNTRGSYEEYPQSHPFWVRRDWIQSFLHRENLALVVATWVERLSHLLVQTTEDRREITLSAAILTGDGRYRQVDLPCRSSWPTEPSSWIKDSQPT